MIVVPNKSVRDIFLFDSSNQREGNAETHLLKSNKIHCRKHFHRNSSQTVFIFQLCHFNNQCNDSM